MKQGKLEAAESIFKKVRTSVQAQESSIGRDSREHSSSPTSMIGRITPPLPVSGPLMIMDSISVTGFRREEASYSSVS